MTLKPTDYALLAEKSYSNPNFSNGTTLDGILYRPIAFTDNPHTGFQAVAYRRADAPDVVIAYRGTEFDREPFHDGIADAAMVLAGINNQVRDAEAFTTEVVNTVRADDRNRNIHTDITVTGHSLGGTLAQINAAKFGLHGQTFNAYGAADLSNRIPEGGHQVINHVRAGDPVSAASRHFGEVHVYAIQRDVDTLREAGYGTAHGMANLRMVRSLEMDAHAVKNFVPSNSLAGTSIIDPENEARYRANKDVVDQFRSDVFATRKHASVAWETRQAVLDTVDHGAHAVGHAAMNTGRSTTQAVGAGANQLANDTRSFAHETRQQFNDGLDTIGGAASRAARDVRDVAIVSLAARPVAEVLNGSKYGSPELDKRVASRRLDGPDHPDNALFQQARGGVHRLDAQQGRQPDHLSENLAGALTVEARREGLSRIDHVVLSDDASRTYAIQGDFNSPFKHVAEVQTELGISASLEKSSNELRAIHVQQVAQPTPELQPNAISQSQTGPALHR
jgi:hypothetical protein